MSHLADLSTNMPPAPAIVADAAAAELVSGGGGPDLAAFDGAEIAAARRYADAARAASTQRAYTSDWGRAGDRRPAPRRDRLDAPPRRAATAAGGEGAAAIL